MTTKTVPPISPEWLRNHVDLLLELAQKFGPETAMGKATLLRAEHIMDMVNSWKEHIIKENNDRNITN